MKQIFKNLLPYWKSVLVIIALLMVQAYCDLSLPQYTSKVIDTGIQNGGVTHILPEKITAEEYMYTMMFMNSDEKNLWEDSYTPDGDLYKRKKLSESRLDELDEKLIVPILVNYQMEAVSVEQFKEMLWENEDLRAALQNIGIDEKTYGQMSGEEVGDIIGLKINTFNKKIEDESGNKVDTVCVDVRKVMAGMANQGVMDESGLEYARDTFEKMADSIGTSTVTSMGIKWAIERNEEAGIDVDKMQINYLWSAGFKMLIVTLIMAVVSVFISYVSSRVGAGIGRDLRRKVFHKVVGYSNTEMDKFSTASLITRCTNDVQQIQMVTIMMLRMILYAPIVGVGGVLKVAETNSGMGWTIALAVVSILSFVILLVSLAMPKFKIMQKLIDKVNLVSREILTGLSVIRAFGRTKKEEERFDEANADLTKTSLFTNRIMTFMMPGMMTIMYGVDILIVWVAAHKIDEGMIQVGTMTAFITYAMMIVISFLMLTMMSVMLPRAGVAANRIQEVLDTDSTIVDTENPVEPEDKKGVVEFKNVSFRYPNAYEDVISNINFVAEPGKTTAIIGSTGCGKSTLVNLIPRLYDVTAGEILIDGVDLRNMSLEYVRDQIGFVPQKGVLFSGTIASNLRFGNRNAGDDEIREAAEIAQAMEFIDAKKEKFDTHISQGGSNVSGGQKQRLAIARAIAKHPKIFVFDDSFSALDMKTDSMLRKALGEKVSDSTVIIVAQRISTIMKADQILVLDEGEIVGKGTHEELLRNCEVYSQIAQSQLSREELGIDVEGGVLA